MVKAGLIFFLSVWAGMSGAMAFPTPNQMVVSIAPGWDSRAGKLQFFERSAGKWIPASPAIPVWYGKSGLAWGLPSPEAARALLATAN